MRNFLITIALFILIGILVSVALNQGFSFAKDGNIFSRSVCDKPVKYKIGNIDPRFNLSEKKVEGYLNQAENVWETPTGRNLFEYDTNAVLAVDFVYDKKQALNTEINQLEGQLNNGKGDLEAKKTQFEKDVVDFNKQVDDLNNQVRFWNNQGGAPPEEYQKLITKQQDLSAQADRLNATAKELNLSAEKYNIGVNKLNQNISEFNSALQKKPEEGLYDDQSKTIDIYFVPSENELVHTLSHELGHALGLGHIEGNPRSIMFPFSSQVTNTSSADIDAINMLCREKSLPEIIVNNFSTIVHSLQSQSP